MVTTLAQFTQFT